MERCAIEIRHAMHDAHRAAKMPSAFLNKIQDSHMFDLDFVRAVKLIIGKIKESVIRYPSKLLSSFRA